jgi:hypothetical protein
MYSLSLYGTSIEDIILGRTDIQYVSAWYDIPVSTMDELIKELYENAVAYNVRGTSFETVEMPSELSVVSQNRLAELEANYEWNVTNY